MNPELVRMFDCAYPALRCPSTALAMLAGNGSGRLDQPQDRHEDQEEEEVIDVPRRDASQHDLEHAQVRSAASTDCAPQIAEHQCSRTSEHPERTL